ncbi:dTDP-4-dehydrorhamnose reductase [Rhizomicrobium electricum]|uniref:dTDP-4-dehydrorhamnose reductase n=1 Tax=Rhizomicrobium electricum TaxID=480070 RepID=A0ABN1ENS9_9PROT|nr:dTDP-4-dehydrorhamnose reductase [Rhizomicrobium electricum]NIJ46967.1 dTDP-4-dehydrorhamnose reductase [Rhizomicrobium electricum]
MKALIIGANGQLGRGLAAAVPEGAEAVAPPEAECNLTDPDQVQGWLDRVRPDVVFNAAAYTAVDAAEQDEAAAERVNAAAVGALAEAAVRVGACLVHVSTDFVFDGVLGRPYAPDDAPNPLSVYGRTKLAGERLALTHPRNLVVRTAWVYDETGRNFVRTMLRLMAERDRLAVVADQIGTPTYARDLAAALWALAGQGASGVFHFTNEGVASWYDFAVAIREEGLAAGALKKAAMVVPIGTKDYPTPARRPAFSVLDKSKSHAAIGVGRHWREALREMMGRLPHA